jgi:FKBP-type peptidyl-prolyl cis-trans isomerase SlyD
MNAFRTLAAALGLLLLPVAAARADEARLAPAIETGSKVSLEYTLRDDDGKVLDSNKGRDPLTYVHGEQQIVPGLEKALDGMHAGEQKEVVLDPADGYGAVDPQAVAEVPKQLIPTESLTVGAELLARSTEGATRLVRIKEIKEETVVIDLNHPLAGKTLHFDVKVVGVEPPGAEAPPAKPADQPVAKPADPPAAKPADQPAATK